MTRPEHELVAEAIRDAVSVMERKRTVVGGREHTALNAAALHGIEQAAASIAVRFTAHDPTFNAPKFYATCLDLDPRHRREETPWPEQS